jgi:hypothetical protein
LAAFNLTPEVKFLELGHFIFLLCSERIAPGGLSPLSVSGKVGASEVCSRLDVRKTKIPQNLCELSDFLKDCGVVLHILSWRDGYLLEPKKRRESGEDKRGFEELLKRD